PRLAVRRGRVALRIVPGAVHEPAGYRPTDRDWRSCAGCPVVTATSSSLTATRSAHRTSHMTRTGQTPWWSSIKRNLISVVPRRWPQLLLKCRAPSAADHSRGEAGRSLPPGPERNAADAGIGRSADPAPRPPLPLRQLRSIEGEMPSWLASWLNG